MTERNPRGTRPKDGSGMMRCGKYIRAVLCLAAVLCFQFHASAEVSAGAVEFFRNLNRKNQVTVADLIRCAARAQGYKGPADLLRETDFLEAKGVSVDLALGTDRPLTKGYAAQVFMAGLSFKASLARHIFPRSQRYAFRAAVHLNVISPEGHPNEPMSGAELMALLSNMLEHYNSAESRTKNLRSLVEMTHAFRSASGVDPSTLRFVMRGRLTEVDGDVEVLKRGETKWTAAEKGVEIGAGDQISTGVDGHAWLRFDKGAVGILPLTQMAVGQNVQDGTAYFFEYYLKFGRIVTSAPKIPGRQIQSRVITPSAVAAIHGSVQEVGFREGSGTVTRTEEGKGYVSALNPARLPQAIQMFMGSQTAPSGAPVSDERISAMLGGWLDGAFTGGEKTGAEAADNEAMTVGEGMEASIPVPSAEASVRMPYDFLKDQSFTDLFPAGTTDLEQTATQFSTEVLDVPPARAMQENLQRDEFRSATSAATSAVSADYITTITSKRPPLPP